MMEHPRLGEASRAAWFGLPENLRMLMTAGLGAGIGYVTYELLYWLNPLEPRATIAWTVAYVISVTRQHGLHRLLTFTEPVPYWPSLRRAYVMYSGELVTGGALQWALTERLAVHHRLAWLICLGFTATTSFFLLKRYVFAGSTVRPNTRGAPKLPSSTRKS